MTAPARGNDPIAALLGPSNRVIAVQQVLTQWGYGQIRPTGIVGPETQDAIRKFEHDYLTRLMQQAHGNISMAARLSGTERRQLGKLLLKHGIETKPFRPL